jgi:hypothetical protein
MLLGIGVSGLCLVCYQAIDQLIGSAMPRALVQKVQLGMSEWAVRSILGEPRERQSDGDWEYARTGNFGYVEITFHRGVVVRINDESIFP